MDVGHRFLCKCKFSFHKDKCLRGQYLSCMFILQETALNYLRLAVPFYPFITDIGVAQFLSLLASILVSHQSILRAVPSD